MAFHVLYNFSTGANSYYTTLQDAMRAVERVGPLDDWEIREVMYGKVSRVMIQGAGRGRNQ